MKTITKLATLVVLLNFARYVVGGLIESVTIIEPMQRPMSLYPDAFAQRIG